MLGSLRYYHESLTLKLYVQTENIGVVFKVKKFLTNSETNFKTFFLFTEHLKRDPRELGNTGNYFVPLIFSAIVCVKNFFLTTHPSLL